LFRNKRIKAQLVELCKKSKDADDGFQEKEIESLTVKIDILKSKLNKEKNQLSECLSYNTHRSSKWEDYLSKHMYKIFEKVSEFYESEKSNAFMESLLRLQIEFLYRQQNCKDYKSIPVQILWVSTMFKEFNYIYSLLEANDPTFEMSEKKKDKNAETKYSFNFGKLVKGYVADWVYRVTQLNTILEREMKLQWSKPNL
jgi:hypothetical protein